MTAILCCVHTTLYAQTDNTELREMFEKDQQSRSGPNIDWETLDREDKAREKRVKELLAANEVKTAHDHFHAAMIFQHGGDTVASGMAVKMMKKAVTLDPSMNKWLLAAAIDRDLMRRGKPQIFGTQYRKNYGPDAKWERYNLDSTKVSDEERKAYGVETLSEQKLKVRQMNMISPGTLYSEGNTIEKTIELIRREHKLGINGKYDTSEGSINQFGYELMAANKMNEALQIFKLNTQLYPDAFNTWDSYGECLLKLGKKDDAIKAYQRSVELNPGNKSAIRVLSENSVKN